MTHILHFQDERSPKEVKFALERELIVLFKTAMEQHSLCMRAEATVVGVAYQFLLSFDAALPASNHYTLTMNVFLTSTPASHFEYYGKSAGSWFEHWTRDFHAVDPWTVDQGSPYHYLQRCKEALDAEVELDSIEAIQMAIVSALKHGASFRVAHKEGGTNVYWQKDRFVRSDYGDCPDEKQFNDEAEFLKMLRQFCHWDVNQHSGNQQRSEIDTWRLMMRRMHLP